MRIMLNQMVVYTCRDAFGEFLLSYTVPYNKTLSMWAKYSKMYRLLQLGAAYNMDKNNVRISVNKEKNTIGDRAILRMASGIVLDLPPNMTRGDWKIVKAQIDVLRMQYN